MNANIGVLLSGRSIDHGERDDGVAVGRGADRDAGVDQLLEFEPAGGDQAGGPAAGLDGDGAGHLRGDGRGRQRGHRPDHHLHYRNSSRYIAARGGGGEPVSSATGVPVNAALSLEASAAIDLTSVSSSSYQFTTSRWASI